MLEWRSARPKASIVNSSSAPPNWDSAERAESTTHKQGFIMVFPNDNNSSTKFIPNSTNYFSANHCRQLDWPYPMLVAAAYANNRPESVEKTNVISNTEATLYLQLANKGRKPEIHQQITGADLPHCELSGTKATSGSHRQHHEFENRMNGIRQRSLAPHSLC